MGKRKPLHKFLALALCLALCLTLLPLTAAAAEVLPRADAKLQEDTPRTDFKIADVLGGQSKELAPESAARRKAPGIYKQGVASGGASIHATAAPITNITPGHAAVVLTAGDVWGDGTGYQMLLDADATAYGTIIPADNNLSTGGDVPASVYAQFEYKIPSNADGALTTGNIVINNSIAIEIPAGTYDYCITNPTPDDKMYIAGGTLARGDDYAFEAGKIYYFEPVLSGNNDQVTLNAVAATTPAKVIGLTAVPGAGQALTCELSWTNPSLNMLGQALTSLEAIVIERNGTVVHTIASPTVGAPESWNDILPVDGAYTYTVYAVSSFGAGETATATAVVGSIVMMGMSSPVTLTAQGAVFTDDGGPTGNYEAYTEQNYVQTMTFLPDAPGNLVRATFTEFNTTVDFDADALYVINGNYADVQDVPEGRLWICCTAT